jgi:hypothetical protein
MGKPAEQSRQCQPCGTQLQKTHNIPLDDQAGRMHEMEVCRLRLWVGYRGTFELRPARPAPAAPAAASRGLGWNRTRVLDAATGPPAIEWNRQTS